MIGRSSRLVHEEPTGKTDLWQSLVRQQSGTFEISAPQSINAPRIRADFLRISFKPHTLSLRSQRLTRPMIRMARAFAPWLHTDLLKPNGTKPGPKRCFGPAMYAISNPEAGRMRSVTADLPACRSSHCSSFAHQPGAMPGTTGMRLDLRNMEPRALAPRRACIYLCRDR